MPAVKKGAIANEIIGELWYVSSSALVDHLGDERSIQVLRPHMILHGREGMLWCRRNLDLGDEPRLAIASVLNIATKAIGFPSKTEIAERGVTLTVYDCPFSDSGRYIFCILDSILFECIYEGVDPGYTDKLVMWRTRGDPYCRRIVRERTAPPEKWSDYGQVVGTLREPNVPMEHVLELGYRHVRGLWILSVQAFIDAVGALEALSVLQPLIGKCGHATGLKLLQLLNIDKEEDLALERVLAFFLEIMRSSEQTWMSDNEVEICVGGCPFCDSPKEICILFDVFVEGLCQAVEPGCKVEITRSDGGGSASCRWRMERLRHPIGPGNRMAVVH